jgi:hypothetical protein
MSEQRLTATIIVTSLGYFVDVFDLVLFSILRVVRAKWNSRKSANRTRRRAKATLWTQRE